MTDLGPASFESPPISTSPANDRRAWAQINLTAIADNVARLVESAPTSAVMAVVKADAYGHGLLQSSRAARAGGASWLGVALLEEAIALRDAGDTGRMLAWLPTPGDQFAECIRADVDLNVSARWMLTQITSAAQTTGRAARIHLKVDTGLGRSGATPADWPDLVREALKAEAAGSVRVVGLWSHFAYADSPRHPTIASQIRVFDEAVEQANELGANPEVCHLANSAATLALPRAHYNLVRPGIAVYGISPGHEIGTSRSLGLTPAMTLGARVVMVKRLPAGHGISYAHQYITKQETTVALIPVGYADGLQRSASSRGPVLAAGRVRTVAGRICMDQFTLDIGNDDIREGDDVVIFGPGTHGEPTADDWATACGTIPYEIVTCVGSRIPRVYVGGN